MRPPSTLNADLVEMRRAPPTGRPIPFHQVRERRDQNHADDHRDHESEEPSDEQSGDQNRDDADRDRGEDAHPVTPGVEQSSERTDNESNDDETYDV
jgi:hypothetical protein